MTRILAKRKFCENYLTGKLISLRNSIYPKIKLDQIFGKNLPELTHGAKLIIRKIDRNRKKFAILKN